MEHTKGLCPCGFPQSYPIPHEHDQTEREKVVIKHFRDEHKELLEACKNLIAISEDLLTWCIEKDKYFIYKEKINNHKQAISKAEGK